MLLSKNLMKLKMKIQALKTRVPRIIQNKDLSLKKKTKKKFLTCPK